MPKLFVFLGKPGAGKSTIIQSALPGVPIYDVASIILTGHQRPIQPEVTWAAYQQIYQDILVSPADDCVMELGTSYPEFNCAQLRTLTDQYRVHVWLCSASVPTLRSRCIAKVVPFTAEALEVRLNRDFPESFQALLEGEGIPHTVLNTENPLEQTVAIIQNAWLSRV